MNIKLDFEKLTAFSMHVRTAQGREFMKKKL